MSIKPVDNMDVTGAPPKRGSLLELHALPPRPDSQGIMQNLMSHHRGLTGQMSTMSPMSPSAERQEMADRSPLSRRSFLRAGASAVAVSTPLALLGMPEFSHAASISTLQASPQIVSRPDIPKWPERDEIRQVWLKRPATGESLVARYFDGQQVSNENYIACCTLLRDVQSGSVVHIDLGLLDLVFSMQKWLVEWGIDRPMTVHSGYRSPATNAREGGALNSMHMQGRALDFHIEGIPSEYMGRLARIFAVGGVGFYIGKTGFTHVDTGRVRSWSQRR